MLSMFVTIMQQTDLKIILEAVSDILSDQSCFPKYNTG